MVIYIGQSPLDEINVALLIDWVTGHARPHFRVSFYPVFQTANQCGFDSLWGVKTIFVNQKGKIG